MNEDAVWNIVDQVKNIQNRNAEDFIGEDGLLRCCVCGERKQKRLSLYGSEKETVVPCLCRCGEEARDAEARRQYEVQQQNIFEKMKRESLMDERFYNATFSNFIETDKNRRNLEICMKYVDTFQKMMEKSQGLLFWGNTGTGKSFAAACIANALLEKHISVIMTSMVKVLELAGMREDEDNVLDRIRTADLVIIDDLGAERGTDYSLEKVYGVIDDRYRSNKPMIITTNLLLKDMLKEQDIRYRRIYDRLFEICYPMEWTGINWRRTQAQERFNNMEKILEIKQ